MKNIQFPPLLNLTDDRPHIDETFTSFEACNSPYLDGMVRPLWKKSEEDTYVVDSDNVHYYLRDNGLYRVTDEEEVLLTGNLRPGVQETFKTHFYLDYLSDDCYVEHTSENRLILTYKDKTYTSQRLYMEGAIISHRLTMVNGEPMSLVYYKTGGVGFFTVLSPSINTTRQVSWKKQYVKDNNATYGLGTTSNVGDIEDETPLIQVCFQSSLYCFSLISHYGTVLSPRDTYFWTAVTDTSTWYVYGENLTPTVSTQTAQLENTFQTYIKWSLSTTTNQTQVSIYSKNNVWYKTEDNTIVSVPSTYSPSPTTNTISVDGEDYKVYTYTHYTVYNTFTFTDYDSTSHTGSFRVLNAQDSQWYTEALSTSVVITTESDFYFSYIKADELQVKFYDYDWQTVPYNTVYNYEYTYYTSGGTIGPIVYPNVFLDSGSMRSFVDFHQNLSSWSYLCNINAYWVDSGTFNGITGTTYTVTPIENFKIPYNCIRSLSYCFGQNFQAMFCKFCNTSAVTPYALGNGTTESTSARFVTVHNSNCSPLRYYAGYVYSGTKNFYSDTLLKAEDALAWTPQGYRTAIGTWNNNSVNLLFNTTYSSTSSVSGLSVSEDSNDMGTIITEWDNIKDNTYVELYEDSIVYTDSMGHSVIVRSTPLSFLSTTLDNRLIRLNTTSFWNGYDSLTRHKVHLASDYNDRVYYGQSTLTVQSLTYINYYKASAVNANYVLSKRLGSSRVTTPVVLARLDWTSPTAYNCQVPDSRDVQAIDCYIGKSTTACYYVNSIVSYQTQNIYNDNTLMGTVWVNGTNFLYNPSLLSIELEQSANLDYIKEGNNTYPLVSSNGLGYLLYDVSGMAYNVSNYFVLQGQFYAVINNKIYSLVYSSGSLIQSDAIVDCRGMDFIGNTPTIAFFYSRKLHSFYSFTGDAALQFIFHASKITDCYDYWYDEGTQSIYVGTNIGLLVFGPKNTYLMDYTGVSSMQFTDNYIYVTTDHTDCLTYYKEDGFSVIPLEIETSFWGLGSGQVETIPRLMVTLFDKDCEQHKAYFETRSITDVTVKKTNGCVTAKADAWSYSSLVQYRPELNKGQGLRFYIKTDQSIQNIAVDVIDMGSDQKTINNKQR